MAGLKDLNDGTHNIGRCHTAQMPHSPDARDGDGGEQRAAPLLHRAVEPPPGIPLTEQVHQRRCREERSADPSAGLVGLGGHLAGGVSVGRRGGRLCRQDGQDNRDGDGSQHSEGRGVPVRPLPIVDVEPRRVSMRGGIDGQRFTDGLAVAGCARTTATGQCAA